MANIHRPSSIIKFMFSNLTKITKMHTSISVFAIRSWANVEKVLKQQKKQYLLIPITQSVIIGWH